MDPLLAAAAAAGVSGNFGRGEGLADEKLASLKQNTLQWVPPKEALDKIPKNWGDGVPNRKPGGFRWQDPNDQGNGVRIDRGNPNNSQTVQQVDHVVVRVRGNVIGRDGQPIVGSIKANYEQSHIPVSEYVNWKSWNSPK